MPIYPYKCPQCGRETEILARMEHEKPECCGGVMNRQFSIHSVKIKSGPPLWAFRIDEIHKAQSDRGERLRFVYPKEVGAS